MTAALLVLSACGDDGRTAGPDASLDDASMLDGFVPDEDAGEGTDAGPELDAGGDDAGTDMDAGGGTDAGSDVDAGSDDDAGPETDAGTEMDAGMEEDAGLDDDAGTETDAGTAAACPEEDLGSTVGSVVASGTTAGASDSASPSCISASYAPDVAHVFTAPAAARYRFDTQGSALDTVLYVLEGDGCSGAELACNDDVGGGLFSSAVEVDLVAGEQVTVVVDAWYSGSGGYVLNVEATEANCDDDVDDDSDGYVDCRDSDCDGASVCIESICDDSIDNEDDGLTDCADSDCADAAACCVDFDLGSATGDAVATGTTTGSSEFDPCSSGGSGPEVLYLWTAPADGTYVFDTCDSSYDTTLWVNENDGTCDGANLACNDDASCGTRSEVTVTLTAGQQVVVGVDGWGSTSSGDYVLDITGP